MFWILREREGIAHFPDSRTCKGSGSVVYLIHRPQIAGITPSFSDNDLPNSSLKIPVFFNRNNLFALFDRVYQVPLL